MDQHALIKQLSSKMKLVRVEEGYTQDRMAIILGISKKTLVQIEKERIEAGWTTIVAMCALFRDSEVIQHSLGADPIEVLETIAHHHVDRPKQRTMGGKVWWTPVMEKDGYMVQQNVISQHFRIIDEQYYRYYSTFDKEEAEEKLQELILSSS
ncbi:transcriptional regulator [Pontibacillus yanchengensis]|uniref:Transcriptional regulator n=2 Tax=Pontibacillus yanchengensis TaxID=462910 RepID=A0ACC7VLM2_9BACI|nr:transcriptional regulator [Pontibacillus yanchengensis]MYL32705.1 transcriptional regulator [Pontibacillus yanchengensis]MYL55099.1 transcriptional regulator [Pontibacillus yanchengensis]